jgi:hypothetical protein
MYACARRRSDQSQASVDQVASSIDLAQAKHKWSNVGAILLYNCMFRVGCCLCGCVCFPSKVDWFVVTTVCVVGRGLICVGYLQRRTGMNTFSLLVGLEMEMTSGRSRAVTLPVAKSNKLLPRRPPPSSPLDLTLRLPRIRHSRELQGRLLTRRWHGCKRRHHARSAARPSSYQLNVCFDARESDSLGDGLACSQRKLPPRTWHPASHQDCVLPVHCGTVLETVRRMLNLNGGVVLKKHVPRATRPSFACAGRRGSLRCVWSLIVQYLVTTINSMAEFNSHIKQAQPCKRQSALQYL